MKDNVKVVVRLRPILPRERLKKCEKCVRVLKERNQIVLGPSRGFVFDDVLSEESTQREVLNVGSLMDRCFKGFNSTILAFGYTGSGKTYTMGMFGEEKEKSEEGIVPRALRRLFELREKKRAT